MKNICRCRRMFEIVNLFGTAYNAYLAHLKTAVLSQRNSSQRVVSIMKAALGFAY